MINLPYNVPLVAPIMPTQSIPVQTSQNNLQPFHQPQTVTQQMQTSPVAFPGNPQDSYKPYYQLHQSDVMFANHQYIPNPPQLRNPYHLIPQAQVIPNPPVAQTQASCGQLPASIVEQIRSAVSNTAPIFILPGGCHQSAGQQQQQPPPVYPSNQGGVSPPTGPSTGFNYPPSIYCPPSFVPYPIPLPLYEPFTSPTRGKEKSQTCGCCHHQSSDTRNHLINSFWSPGDSQEHHCTMTLDDTICSKRNCPASISLQALASQFLSLPGIVSCAATRLILRKVHGSNITNSMEEIMEKAQKAIGMLGKDQLFAESRIAQQVNALINLHATTNLPASVIPLLMLVQTKVNVLKAQIENLVNRKVMECQGYGFEVETSGPIDPTVLALKSNAELRQLLGALRQKECDERMNVNFAPYHSQRVIAESRLHNVRAKIRQVEVEFDNRRQVTVPGPTLTSQIIRQFSESRCTFGYAPSRLFEPCVLPDSPDPFSPTARNPRRLYIKPHQPEPPSASGSGKTPTSKDTGTGEGTAQCDTKDQSVGRRCSKDSCICEGSSSEDSLVEDKKKLRAIIDGNDKGRVTILEPHEEDHSNVEDGECQAPCEVPETVEQDGSKEPEEKRGGEKLLTIEEVQEAEGSSKIDDRLRFEESESKLAVGTKVEHEDEEEQSSEDSKVTEAEGTKEEQSDKEEQTSSQSPEDSTEKETKEGTKNLKKKGYANIRVIKTGERSDKIDLGDETKPEDGNVQIVSMMTNIVYDRSAGDFGRYMTNCADKKFGVMENSMDEVFRVGNPENAKNAEKISSPKVCNMNEEREHESGVNSCLRDPTERQSTFTEGLGSHNRKVTGDFKHFPPLRRAETKISPQSVPDQDRLDSSKIDRDGSTSGHQEASSRVASAIRSMIGDRLDYVGSLVDNVPNLQTIISSLYSKRLWSAATSRRGNMEPNKTAISRNDDWILLPTDIDRETETQTRERYLPVGNELYRVRKIKHTIISNRAGKSYVLIGGSTSGQLRELSGIRLIKPSGIRRSFVIRSRLKDQNFKQLNPPPVVSLRRFKTDKTSASPKLKGSDRRLEPSEKFCSLCDKKEDNTVTKVPASYNDVSDDRSEQITNVYDYSAEQEQLGVQSSNGHHEFISIWQ